MAKYVKTEQGYIDASIFAPAQFKPEGKSYLTFSSPKGFTLAVYDKTKHWDGTLEFFNYDKTWTTWDGTTILSAYNNDGEYVLYLRGTGNTVITNGDYSGRWILSGTNIKCIGNIDNLLDYATVESGNHPTMANNCYKYMFQGCTALTQAPALPATTLANNCYNSMFYNCTSLTQAPALPATTLANSCYAYMFSGCTALTQAPALPATTLAINCYAYMFSGTSITQTPALPATTLAINCYQYMFVSCTSLTQAPALPATTLADNCYQYMFRGCTSLIKAPELPATTLTAFCYHYMFSGCTSLIKAPELPATTLANNCYQYMFSGCTSLTQVPALPATTLANYCYYGMFDGCGALKFSETKTKKYNQAYRIPTTGTGTNATDALVIMFPSTSGIPIGKPQINTTYYLSTDNMIVRDTEVTTLNGYVGSMIDVAAGVADLSLGITGATVGQIAKITAVDGNGVPTAWEPVDDRLPNASPSDAGKVLAVEQTGEFEYGYGFADIPKMYDFINLGIDAASPGQFVKVAHVDDFGHPTSWEAVDMPAEYIIPSSTQGSTKKFKITVDDSGTITTTEVT